MGQKEKLIEQLEKLSGKKVILKEGYEESLKRIISSKLKEIAVEGITRSTFLNAVNILATWYSDENAELSELRDPDFDLQGDIFNLLDACSYPEQGKIVAEVIGEVWPPEEDD